MSFISPVSQYKLCRLDYDLNLQVKGRFINKRLNFVRDFREPFKCLLFSEFVGNSNWEFCQRTWKTYVCAKAYFSVLIQCFVLSDISHFSIVQKNSENRGTLPHPVISLCNTNSLINFLTFSNFSRHTYCMIACVNKALVEYYNLGANLIDVWEMDDIASVEKRGQVSMLSNFFLLHWHCRNIG